MKIYKEDIAIFAILAFVVALNLWHFFGYEPLDIALDTWVDANGEIFYSVVAIVGLYCGVEFVRSIRKKEYGYAIEYGIALIFFILLIYLVGKEIVESIDI